MSDKVDKVKTLLALMQSKAEEFDRAGLDEEAQSIYNSIKYLNDMKSDNDRLLFVESTPDFTSWMLGNVSGNDAETKQVKDIKTAVDEEGAARRDLEYDDEGNRILTRSEIMKELGVDENSPSVAFSVDSEKSLYKMKPERIRAMARSLGVSTQDFIKAYYDEAKKYEQNKAVNDGTISGKITQIAFPRITEKVAKGKEVSPLDAVMDVGETALTFTPVGTGAGIANKAARIAVKTAGVPIASEIGDVATNQFLKQTGEDYNESRATFDPKRVADKMAGNLAFNSHELLGMATSGLGRLAGIPLFTKSLSNKASKVNAVTNDEKFAQGMKTFEDYDNFLNGLDNMKVGKSRLGMYGDFKNVKSNLTPEQVEIYEKLMNAGITESAAVNQALKGIAKEYTGKNPAKNLQEASDRFFSKLKPKERMNLVQQSHLDGNADLGEGENVLFDFGTTSGKKYGRYKNIPYVYDNFHKVFKSSPFGSMLEKKPSKATQTMSVLKSLSPLASNKITSFDAAKATKWFEESADEKEKKEQLRKQEMTNKHIQQLQAGWRKAMGMN